MMTNEQLKARDTGRDIGTKLLQSVREMTAGRWARKTTFEGSMPFRMELDIRHSGGLARRPVPLPVQRDCPASA